MPTLIINGVDIDVTDEVKILTEIPKSGVLHVEALGGLVFGVFGAEPTINPPSDTPHRWVPGRIHAIVSGPRALAVCATDCPPWQAPKPRPEKPALVALEDTPEEIARRRAAKQQAALERHVLATLTQEYLDSFR